MVAKKSLHNYPSVYDKWLNKYGTIDFEGEKQNLQQMTARVLNFDDDASFLIPEVDEQKTKLLELRKALLLTNVLRDCKQTTHDEKTKVLCDKIIQRVRHGQCYKNVGGSWPYDFEECGLPDGHGTCHEGCFLNIGGLSPEIRLEIEKDIGTLFRKYLSRTKNAVEDLRKHKIPGPLRDQINSYIDYDEGPALNLEVETPQSPSYVNRHSSYVSGFRGLAADRHKARR